MRFAGNGALYRQYYLLFLIFHFFAISFTLVPFLHFIELYSPDELKIRMKPVVNCCFMSCVAIFYSLRCFTSGMWKRKRSYFNGSGSAKNISFRFHIIQKRIL